MHVHFRWDFFPVLFLSHPEAYESPTAWYLRYIAILSFPQDQWRTILPRPDRNELAFGHLLSLGPCSRAKSHRQTKVSLGARQKLTQQSGSEGRTCTCSAASEEQFAAADEDHGNSLLGSESSPTPQSSSSWQDFSLPIANELPQSPSGWHEAFNSPIDPSSTLRDSLVTAAVGIQPPSKGLHNHSAQSYYPTPSFSAIPSPYIAPLESVDYSHMPFTQHQPTLPHSRGGTWPENYSTVCLTDEFSREQSHNNCSTEGYTQAASLQWNDMLSESVDPPQYELLSESANPRPGGNLLHIAIKNGSGGIAHTLVVGGGADVDARDVANGDRPLHCAVRARSISMSRMLLHHGARLDLRNDAGLTPLDLAVRLQEEEIVELLIEGGARVL